MTQIERVVRGARDATPSSAISAATLSNCGKVLKLTLPLSCRKAVAAPVNDLGYGKNAGDVTMDNLQPFLRAYAYGSSSTTRRWWVQGFGPGLKI